MEGGIKSIATAGLAGLALFSGAIGLIGNLGGARDTICSFHAASRTCEGLGLIRASANETSAALSVAPPIIAPAKTPEAAAPIAAAAPAKSELSGSWTGYYFGGGNPKTKFEMDVSVREGVFRGVIAEDDSIGRGRGVSAADAVERGSTVKGRIGKDGSVHFVKEYDCSDGVCHEVVYEGLLDETGRTITGTWSIGDLHGEFRMSRS